MDFEIQARRIDGRELVYPVETALLPEDKERGLSGRPALAAGTGMLFVWAEDVQFPFTAADMRFPLDILFIDRNGQVVHSALSVPPGTVTIASPVPYRFVLELPGGTVERDGLALDERLMAVLRRPLYGPTPQEAEQGLELMRYLVCDRPVLSEVAAGSPGSFFRAAGTIAAQGALIAGTLYAIDRDAKNAVRNGMIASAVIEVVRALVVSATTPDALEPIRVDLQPVRDPAPAPAALPAYNDEPWRALLPGG